MEEGNNDQKLQRSPYESRLDEYWNIALSFTEKEIDDPSLPFPQEEEEEVEEVQQQQKGSKKKHKKKNKPVRQLKKFLFGGGKKREKKEKNHVEDDGESNDNSAQSKTFLARTNFYGNFFDNIDSDYFNQLCQKVVPNGEKADFELIFLVRLLILMKKSNNQEIINRIRDILKNFHFWTTSKHQLNNVSFWSENHTFMYLSSAYIYYEMYPWEGHATEKDKRHLLAYLHGHCHPEFQGVYEVLSAIYLPYTISALLNLYDFTRNALEDMGITPWQTKINEESKEQGNINENLIEKRSNPEIEYQIVNYQSLLLINKIVYSFALVANKNGICNLSASTRFKPNSKKKNFGHNINQLIYLLTGETVDVIKVTPIVEFLLTSNWRPQNEVNEIFLQGEIFITQKMNHKEERTRDIYTYQNFNKKHETPFYW